MLAHILQSFIDINQRMSSNMNSYIQKNSFFQRALGNPSAEVLTLG